MAEPVPSPVPTPTPPPPPVSQAPDNANADVLARLERIERDGRVRNVQDELGLSPTQASAVHDLMTKHSLPAQQAHMLAQQANPTLFKQPDPADFNPAAGHGAARPAGGMPVPPPPPKDPDDEWWKTLETLPSRKQADALNNRLGHLAAEAAGMGDSHKLLEL